jgi:hypothetical protein
MTEGVPRIMTCILGIYFGFNASDLTVVKQKIHDSISGGCVIINVFGLDAT